MSTRTIITIDEGKCNGCGLCIPNCPEGALQVIDGKARLISDLFCDGLGACVGYCPEGAITLTEREAEPYDERKVMANIVRQGANTIRAHLEHLDGHGEKKLLAQALEYLAETGTAVPEGWGHADKQKAAPVHCSAGAGGRIDAGELADPAPPPLAHGPAIQGQGRAALGGLRGVRRRRIFMPSMLKGKVLAIACPKLDDGKDIYREKITAMIDHAQINTLTVLMMQVPCCRGLLAIAQQALQAAKRKVPLKAVIVSIDGGKVLSEEWV